MFEDLQIQNMMQNHHLAKSVSDASWSQLISLTKSKAEYAGKIVEVVNPRNTSQICSNCGQNVPKKLTERIHLCPSCGLKLDRDHNAALNILDRSVYVPTDCRELTPVESSQWTLEEAGSLTASA